MYRTPVPKDIQTRILTLSKRRCALCYGLCNSLEEQQGQIAHLDKNPNNNNIDNLAYLCLNHHDLYDGRKNQSKNYTIEEVKYWRNLLYKANSLKVKSADVLASLNTYMTRYHHLFEFLFTQQKESAYFFHYSAFELLDEIVSNWSVHKLQSNDTDILNLQNEIAIQLDKIHTILNTSDYHSTGNGLIFTWKEDQKHNEKLENIKNEMMIYISNIKFCWDKLREIQIQ